MFKKALLLGSLASLLLLCAACSLTDKTAIPAVTQTPTVTSSESPAPSSSPSPSPSASSSPEDTSSPAPSPNDTSSPDVSASPDVSSSADVSPSTSIHPPETSSKASASDFTKLGEALLTSDGLGAVRVNMTERDLTKALGQPAEKTEPEVWAADNAKHTDWNYDSIGLIVDLVKTPQAKNYVVYSVRAMDPCTFKTKRNIAIGASKASVLKAYEKEYNADESDDSTLVLGTKYGGINIIIADDKVAEIFIGATAE